MQNLAESINSLPINLQSKVFSYIAELKKTGNKPKKRLTMKWAGGLKEYKDRFTSLELQIDLVSGKLCYNAIMMSNRWN